MAIENANYVAELNKLYPAETEAVADGDDHFRLIKKVLQQTFPGRAQPEGARLALSGASVAVDATMLGAYVEASTATAITLPKLGTDYAGYVFLLATGAAATITGSGGDTINGAANQASPAGTIWRFMGESSTGWICSFVHDSTALTTAGGTMTGALKNTASQIGTSGTATNNFSLEPTSTGSMKLARGNAGSTTQDIMTVDSSGLVAFTQSPQGSNYAVLPGGLQVCWGTATDLGGGGGGTITFGRAFSVAPVVTANFNHTSGLVVIMTVGDITTSGAKGYAVNGSGTMVYATFTWIAVGKA